MIRSLRNINKQMNDGVDAISSVIKINCGSTLHTQVTMLHSHTLQYE